MGISAGLGGLLAACGDEGSTTTTTAANPGTTGTTIADATTTTVSAGPEVGRQLKIGDVAPITGAMAAFGIPEKYCVQRAQEAIGDGIVCGDGLKHPIKLILSDSQSDSNRASQVAADLILNEQVDMLVCGSSVATIIPVADQAEANGVPFVSCDNSWQNWVGARSKGDLTATFKWTYNAAWGIDDVVPTYVDLYNQIQSNKRIAVCLGNDALGQTWLPILKKALPAAGLTGTFPDLYQPGTEDYTALISAFKRDGCELAYGTYTAPDFANFWTQSQQQSWKPTTTSGVRQA